MFNKMLSALIAAALVQSTFAMHPISEVFHSSSQFSARSIIGENFVRAARDGKLHAASDVETENADDFYAPATGWLHWNFYPSDGTDDDECGSEMIFMQMKYGVCIDSTKGDGTPTSYMFLQPEWKSTDTYYVLFKTWDTAGCIGTQRSTGAGTYTIGNCISWYENHVSFQGFDSEVSIDSEVGATFYSFNSQSECESGDESDIISASTLSFNSCYPYQSSKSMNISNCAGFEVYNGTGCSGDVLYDGPFDEDCQLQTDDDGSFIFDDWYTEVAYQSVSCTAGNGGDDDDDAASSVAPVRYLGLAIASSVALVLAFMA